MIDVNKPLMSEASQKEESREMDNFNYHST